jgi:hypothetical protein
MSLENLTRFNDEEIKQLKESVWNAPVIYEWDAVEQSTSEFGIFAIAFFSIIIPVICYYFLSENIFNVLVFFVGSIFFMYPYTRFLLMPDEKNHYQLTSVGVRYTSKKDIPDFVYTAVRYIAWGGVLLSVFAMAIMGPLALVGAGGFALLAVGFVNYKPKIENHEFFFLDELNIKYCKKDNVIWIFTDCDDLYLSNTVYLNEDRYSFFNALSKQVIINNYVEVKSTREF